MPAYRYLLMLLVSWVIVLGFAGPVAAQHMRDISVPVRGQPNYEKSRLLGHWFEVARSKSRFEYDCHGVTADVELRDDSRLTLKIDCHKGSVSGPVLDIDSILVEVAPAVFEMRFVRFRAFGHQTAVVLWQAEDDSLAVLGSPSGEFGWVWSKSVIIDQASLDLGREKLVAAGYLKHGIRPVKH